jgi:hypothetical protein
MAAIQQHSFLFQIGWNSEGGSVSRSTARPVNTHRIDSRT